MDRKIIIGHLFKDQLNSYGDGGNVDVLRTRLKERNIGVKVREYAINENIDFDELDIIYIGGGRSRETRLVVDCLRDWTEELKTYIESGKVLLVTGKSLSIFGKAYINPQEEIPGLGILNMVTEKLEDDLEGQVIIESTIDNRNLKLIGYQSIDQGYNHDYPVLAEGEGLIYKHMLGTSLHGPVLAKNGELADILIKWAFERKYGNMRLTNLNDHLENKLRKTIDKKNV